MLNFFLFIRNSNIFYSFSIVFSYDYWDFFYAFLLYLLFSIFCFETMSCCFPPYANDYQNIFFSLLTVYSILYILLQAIFHSHVDGGGYLLFTYP